MTRTGYLGAALFLLGACSTIESETFQTIELNGQPTELRTRTIAGPDGSAVTHSVRSSNGTYRTCDPDQPGSCASAARADAGGKGR
ncbi:hypothetical protein [Roseobacter weihaiensis]|uniref:hypothetical protein n=1 Tax=Roseobacter weihaiensis TaxID=2763262 RepID=UPI001D0A3076|nr:hypothetical protein [Roseobacter sp. H9]